MNRSLDLEIAYFDAHIDELRAQADREGRRAVLIHDRRVQGFFDSTVEAAQAGYERFGPEPFLARSVDEPTQASVASIFATTRP